MLKVGDTVKVISKTLCNDEEQEFIPVGTICTVTEVCANSYTYYGVKPKDGEYEFYYLESELEKGELVWIADKEEK